MPLSYHWIWYQYRHFCYICRIRIWPLFTGLVWRLKFVDISHFLRPRSLKTFSNIYVLRNLSSIEYMQKSHSAKSCYQFYMIYATGLKRKEKHWQTFLFKNIRCLKVGNVNYFGWNLYKSILENLGLIFTFTFPTFRHLIFLKRNVSLFLFSPVAVQCSTLIVQKKCDGSHYLFNFLGKFNFSCILLVVSLSDETYLRFKRYSSKIICFQDSWSLYTIVSDEEPSDMLLLFIKRPNRPLQKLKTYHHIVRW